MSVTVAIDRKVLADAVDARLRDQLPGVQGYQGEAVDVPRLPTAGGDANTDGLVVPYWVLHVSPGTPGPELDLADTVVDIDWGFTITCAGAFVADVQALMSDVDAAIFRWRPIVAGLVCGPCKPPFGFTPGPIRPDRTFTPHRPYVPLEYVSHITKT